MSGHASATIAGRIGRVDALRHTENSKVLSIVVAINRMGRDSVTDWWSVTFWGKTAENAATILQKGDRVVCTGRPQLESYTKDGVEKFKLELASATFTQMETKSERSGGYGDDE